MNRKLTTDQIEATCHDLLSQHRHVTVRMLMAELHHRFGSTGRTARVGKILHRLETTIPPQPSSAEIAALLERLAAAEARAARSEQLERHHQDYWATRYAEKADEIERKYAAVLRSRPAITLDEYLRLQQQLASLERRLAEYE